MMNERIEIEELNENTAFKGVTNAEGIPFVEGADAEWLALLED